MKKILLGSGARSHGTAFAQGREAASSALAQVEKLPPALAIVLGRDPQGAGEILRGVREVLGECPLLGIVSAPAVGGVPPDGVEGVRVFLFASRHLRVKVGVGESDQGGWEDEARVACQNSFIPGSLPNPPDDATERNLYLWYLYRRPSLAIAAMRHPVGDERSPGRRIVRYLKRRLHGRVPLLALSPPPGSPEAVMLADGRVQTRGVALAMIKTDLRFALERFHAFEPTGSKLFVTRAEGNRIVELNRMPAIEAYRQALGLDPGAAAELNADPGPFSLFPLAARRRDGRFNLLMPERVDADGSLQFSTPLQPDQVLYPMKALPSSDFWRSPTNDRALLLDMQKLSAAAVLRDADLRDLPHVVPDLGAGGAVRPVELICGSELKAYLPGEDGEADAGHLLLSFERELDPIAVAATEHERLLAEVIQLKDLHQKIFDSIGYGIAVVDASRRILFCNNTYRVLMAGSPAQLEGHPCPWAIDGTAVCGSCAAVEAIATGAPVDREVVRLAEDRSHWYRLDTFPLRDAAGKVTAAIEVMRDVTAFKHLSFSLESEQRKMEAVLRGMGETLYIVNRSYDLQFFHRGAFPVDIETGGTGPASKCHRTIFRREHPCPWCRMPETLLSGGIERRVSHLADAEGEERSYQITFSPWGVGQVDRGSVVCLLVDISAQKRLEQQMVLSEKLNSLSILSAGMAHELNNPLGAINFNLEILKRRERDGEYQEVLESIRKDVLRINRIVGNLLSFSRSKPASSGGVSLPEVIETSLELFQVVIERRHIEVRKSWAEGVPQVWGNAQDLQQVFINLIANAVDAMPSGGAIDIAVGLDEKAVQDGGASIAVVYDNAGDLAFLRTLADLPGCDVCFFHGDEEAIDALRQSPSTPPEILILDYADANADRISFFITMVKECAPDARVLVMADPGGAEQSWERFPEVAGVLSRLVGSQQVLERVRALVAELRAQRRRPAGILVSFSDTGVGIPPEIHERIFDPFFTTKDVKGTGLGLSVVHKILENHGASIRVGSSLGAGTHFTMKFPQAQPAGHAGPFRLQQDSGFRRVVT